MALSGLSPVCPYLLGAGKPTAGLINSSLSLFVLVLSFQMLAPQYLLCPVASPELLLWLLVQRQVNTKASQFAKHHEMGNIVGDLETFPLNPEPPSISWQGRKDRRDMSLPSRMVFLQNNFWGGGSPACSCSQPPCLGKSSPNAL